jgi:hypothetical protein
MPAKPQDDDDGFSTSPELSYADEDAPASPPADLLERLLDEELGKLRELREGGLITQEEYEKLRDQAVSDYR